MNMDSNVLEWNKRMWDKHRQNPVLSLHSWIPSHYPIDKTKDLNKNEITPLAYQLTGKYVEQYQNKKQFIKQEDKKTVYSLIFRIIACYLRHQQNKKQNH